MQTRTTYLSQAKKTKDDEFYTQFCDIKKECDQYLSHFKDKIIYCNCDTRDSNFVKYFMELKANGLIKDILYSGGLHGADFRSSESIQKLTQADIVISNPPFSLFREYVAQLIEHKKQFLIIGNFNAVKYKSIFPLIKENKLFVGTRAFCGGMFFDVPNPENLIDNKSYKLIDGIPKANVSATWFTNIKAKDREFLNLTRTYNPDDYPKYDNANAINVNDKRHIPYDYYGAIGVPLTFLDKHSPDQFFILGMDRDLTSDGKVATLSGRPLYGRIFICRKEVANSNECLDMMAA